MLAEKLLQTESTEDGDHHDHHHEHHHDHHHLHDCPVSELPDLTDRLKEQGIYGEYVQWRDKYHRWRRGEAVGAKGENTIESHEKAASDPACGVGWVGYAWHLRNGWRGISGAGVGASLLGTLMRVRKMAQNPQGGTGTS